MPDWKTEIRRRLAKSKLGPARETAIIDELSEHLDDCYDEWLSRDSGIAGREGRPTLRVPL